MIKEKIKVGVIGLGQRGMGYTDMLLFLPDVEIKAVCDKYDDRVDNAVKLIKSKTGSDVKAYKDYKQLIAAGGLDAAFVFTSWETHIKIAVDTMRAGIYTAIEVGGASSTEECWRLVRTSEDTGVHCMLLENCNYGRDAMAALRMVKEGLFGDLIYLTGAYQHDLRDEVGLGREIRHYRYSHFMHRNAELYPTHEIGPIAKYLNINRGNRFLTLTSISTKSQGLAEYFVQSRKAYNSWVSDELKNYSGVHPEHQPDYDMIGKYAACGDVVTTTIKCAGGELVTIIHDCTLPRPRYNNKRIQGTKGIWMGDTETIYIEGREEQFDTWESDKKYFDEYDHPLWKERGKQAEDGEFGAFGGHGGTDILVMEAFIEAVKHQKPPPIDAYDAATWMAITCLSEESIALGGAPVSFPDFTNGAWMNREPCIPSKYATDRVYWECFE